MNKINTSSVIAGVLVAAMSGVARADFDGSGSEYGNVTQTNPVSSAGAEQEQTATGGAAEQESDNSNGVNISEFVESTARSLALSLNAVQMDQSGIHLPGVSVTSNDLSVCFGQQAKKDSWSIWIAGNSDVAMDIKPDQECVRDILNFRLINKQADMNDKHAERQFDEKMKRLDHNNARINRGMDEYCPSERVTSKVIRKDEHNKFCHDVIEASIRETFGDSNAPVTVPNYQAVQISNPFARKPVASDQKSDSAPGPVGQ